MMCRPAAYQLSANNMRCYPISGLFEHAGRLYALEKPSSYWVCTWGEVDVLLVMKDDDSMMCLFFRSNGLSRLGRLIMPAVRRIQRAWRAACLRLQNFRARNCALFLLHAQRAPAAGDGATTVLLKRLPDDILRLIQATSTA